MADNRKIIQGVRVDNETITDVDKLAAVATPEMLERLTVSGAIEGDWGLKAKTEAEPKAKAGKAGKKE